MIFGVWNPEKIWHKNLTDCPPRLSDVATIPWEIQKSFSTVLFMHTSGYLRYLTRKQSVIHLPTPPENVTTLTYELQNFFVCVLSDVGGSEKPVVGCRRWLWKEPVVTCGNWNVRQAMSQQVFRVTIFWINTCFQSFSTPFSHIVHHAVLNFSPRRNKPLLQA